MVLVSLDILTSTVQYHRSPSPTPSSLDLWSFSQPLVIATLRSLAMLYTLTLPLILSLLLVSLGALAANIPSLPSGWSYTGCLYEGNGQRIMTDECELHGIFWG